MSMVPTSMNWKLKGVIMTPPRASGFTPFPVLPPWRSPMSGKAESRLVYSSISMSERVANLGVKGALLFTWLLTHCDSQGRMLGKPMVVKAEVVPFLEDITAEEVHGSLLKMAD